ncbi:2Fe-2S iron-sulfur cluster-binding protein [Thauera sinica]|uniref:2Fe-2S iron-sulfur cluster-binding protein n=1 Tax=Thauera sinica TaxID=2665146 RepID=A0ABW1ATE9_9RHOO|nr:ferredoxin [Thauera sp. K11]
MGSRSFTVSISNTGEEFVCSEEDNLLKGMEQLSRKGIPVGCRGGGCGVCKVQIDAGEFRTIKMSRAYVTHEEEASGVVLACRVFPQSDVALTVLGKMVKKFELYALPARRAAPAPASAPQPAGVASQPGDGQEAP